MQIRALEIVTKILEYHVWALSLLIRPTHIFQSEQNYLLFFQIFINLTQTRLIISGH